MIQRACVVCVLLATNAFADPTAMQFPKEALERAINPEPTENAVEKDTEVTVEAETVVEQDAETTVEVETIVEQDTEATVEAKTVAQQAVEPASEIISLNINASVKRALNKDFRLKESEALTDVARALESKAKHAAYPRVELSAIAHLAEGTEGRRLVDGNGNIVARDGFLEHGVSLATRLDSVLLVPIYTFGLIDAYKSAATNYKDLVREDERKARITIMQQVYRAYYGYLAARNTGAFLKSLSEQIKSFYEEKGDTLSESDGYLLQSVLYQLEAHRIEADSLTSIAEKGLRLLVGLDEKDAFTLDEELIEFPNESFDSFLAAMHSFNPDLIKLRKGIEARGALVDVAKASYYPQFFAGVIFSAGYAPGRESADSLYFSDRFNFVDFTPGIGMRFSFDFMKDDELDGRIAEKKALEYKMEYAKEFLPLKLRIDYDAVRKEHAQIQAFAKSARSARQSLLTLFLADEEEADAAKLASSLQSYTLSTVDYWKSWNAYHQAIATLQATVGKGY